MPKYTPEYILNLINDKYDKNMRFNQSYWDMPPVSSLWRITKHYLFPYMHAPRMYLKNCIRSEKKDIDLFRDNVCFTELIHSFQPVLLPESFRSSDPMYISDYATTRYILNYLLKEQYLSLHPDSHADNCLDAIILSELQRQNILDKDNLTMLLLAERPRELAGDILDNRTVCSNDDFAADNTLVNH